MHGNPTSHRSAGIAADILWIMDDASGRTSAQGWYERRHAVSLFQQVLSWVNKFTLLY